MKRKMFSLVMLLLCMVSSSELYAFNEGAIGQRIPCPGKLTRVYMNGEKTAGQSVTAYLTKTSEGVYTVELGEFQVGSMLVLFRFWHQMSMSHRTALSICLR